MNRDLQFMFSKNFRENKIRLYFLFAAFTIGIIHTWLLRYFIDGDGISYLDMGDAFFQGNWKALINGVWSPIYAIIMGLFLYLFKPNYIWESMVVHLANFFIYLFAFFCFDFFLNQLIQKKEKQEARLSKHNIIPIQNNLLKSIGYSLFIWSTMNLVPLSRTTPDLLVSAFVYLLTGILLKIQNGDKKWLTFVLFGMVLGFGYLSKESMFLIGFIFILTGLFTNHDFKLMLPRVLISLIIFLLISSPYIAALSDMKGYFTFGETGKQNYHWYANTNVCEPFKVNTPNCRNLAHHIKELFGDPRVIEYPLLFKATYPPWYDPSYWYEGGFISHFDFKGQLKAILISIKDYFDILLQIHGILFALIILFLISTNKISFVKDLKEQRILLLPSVLVLVMYSLVHVESRYIAPFIVLIYIGLLSVLKFSDFSEMKKVLKVTSIALTLFMSITSVFSKDIIENRPTSLNDRVNWQIASTLKKIRIKEGEKVALLGNTEEDVYWARLIKAHIVAEIHQQEDVKNFWIADLSTKTKVLNAFKLSGAKIIVAENTPANTSKLGWRNIQDTPYSFYIL